MPIHVYPWLLLGVLLFAGQASAVEIYFFQRGYVEGGNAPATTLTDAAVAAFQKGHPEVHVHIVGVPWGREGDLKLRTALLARRRIDCFRLAHDQLPAFLPRQGTLLAPADPLLTAADRDDFGTATLAAVSDHGRVMAWPLWSTALALAANREILERARVTPPEGRPWTWDEFRAALEQVTAQGKKDGTGVQGLNAAARPPLFEWAPLLMAHCGPLFIEGAAPAADGTLPLAPGLTEALGKVRALGEAGLMAETFGVDDAPAARKSFTDGRVAFLLTSPGFIKDLTAAKFPFVLLPPPTGDWGRPITTGALGCFAVVDSGDPARIAAAHALARFLTSAEIAEAVPGWYLGPPARRSVKSFFEQPAYRPLAAILPTARYLSPPVSAGFYENIFIPQLQAALLGQATPGEAIATIQAAARRQALR